ncbi:MAG: transposase, partial [Polaribacter sp.]
MEVLRKISKELDYLINLVLIFKLHIVINDKGEILNFTITQANVDDRTPLKKKSF